jgi:hypothetical protein
MGDLVAIFYYAMQDKPAIVNFLLERFYIQENDALARQLCERNREIARLRQENEMLISHCQDLQMEINSLQNTDRILYDRDGVQHLFRRNASGHYVEVVDPFEEALSSVRRRLNFESEPSEDENSDDEFMSRLLGFE